eukprot:m.328785 g.328785  ORF g.328785 m.328785 type:complete len:361 (-) comp20437_c0_seq8:84-1166(-)
MLLRSMQLISARPLSVAKLAVQPTQFLPIRSKRCSKTQRLYTGVATEPAQNSIVHQVCNMSTGSQSASGKPIAESKHSVCWGDSTTSWDLLFFVLKIADSSQSAWYHLPGQSPAVVELGITWESACVTRANAIRLHRPRKEWPDLVTVHSWCSRVGSSSWDMSQRIVEESSGLLLCDVITTMVSVDETLVKTRRLNDPEAIREMISPPALEASTIPKSHTARVSVADGHASKADVFNCTIEETVRLCDTDALGHVNNAKYVYLATEAVHAAMQAHTPTPAVCESVELLEQAETLYIDYSGQMRPGDAYTCAVEMSHDRIHCDFDLVKTRGGVTSDGPQRMCSLTLGMRTAATPEPTTASL